MIIIVMMMVIMMITTNDSDNDENNDNDDNNKNDNKLPMGPPHKGPIILSFDVTIVESKNNSRVSGDLRCHVPHVTSLWCDIFTQHRHICIVESSYEWNSSYMSICIQNCVRCNWLWCFGNPAMQSAMDSPHKRPLILHLDVCFVVSLSKFMKQQSSCWCWKTCYFVYIFYHNSSLHTNSKINHDYNLIIFSLQQYISSSTLLIRSFRT